MGSWRAEGKGVGTSCLLATIALDRKKIELVSGDWRYRKTERDGEEKGLPISSDCGSWAWLDGGSGIDDLVEDGISKGVSLGVEVREKDCTKTVLGNGEEGVHAHHSLSHLPALSRLAFPFPAL